MRKIKAKLKKFSPKYVSSKRRRLLRVKNHPLIVPVTTFLVLLVLTAVGYVILSSQSIGSGDSHVIILTVDRNKRTIPTRATTVGDFLKRVKIKINSGDVVEPAQSSQIVEDNFRVNVYRAQPITIVDGGHKTFAFSAATTPRSIAQQAGVKVYPEDFLNIKIPEKILHTASIGQELVIDRATLAYLNLYGTPTAIRTHATTVGELLKDENIILGSKDELQPKPSTPIKAGISIIVTQKGTKIISVTEAIPAPTKIIEDDSLSFGATALRQQGAPGKKLVTYQIITKNGKEVARKKIQEIIAEHPVTEIIARGRAVYIPADKSVIMAAAGIRSSDYAYVNFIVSHESGWCPTKLQGQVGYCPGYAPSYIPDNLGYGLGQATPGSKMSGFGSDWKTSAVTQLHWATSYAGKYGGWAGAYNFWSSHSYW